MEEPATIKNLGIQKEPTGIEGFDKITIGGLPCARTTLIIGGPGSGKTVFALQTLVNGARMYGEPGVFVAFEENSQQIIENAATFGWDLQQLEKEKLFFLDARMSSDVIKAGQFDLSGLLASLAAKVEQMKATRIVLDSIGVLLTLLENPISERLELYRVHEWLSKRNLTGIITARLEEGEQLNTVQRYDFLQFMADTIVLLRHRLVERVSLRDLRVVKYRGSRFSENAFPFVFGKRGIEVFGSGTSEGDYPVFTERVSTGIELLDQMLAGGYYRGSSTLITGAPGTAKSTLAGSFIRAACSRGERALYASFDEAASTIVRNLASVNVQFAPYVESGLLHLYSARIDDYSAEEHLMQLKNLIELYQPTCLVIDPISAMLKAGGESAALSMARRLLHITRSRGITFLATSLLDSSNALTEATPIQISTLADTWIHLSYVIQGGERNRALTIIKSRGTGHSNQVRELLLSDQGITLQNVYTAGGEVLMGTLRWEKEAANEIEKQRARQEVERRQRELEIARAETAARIENLQRELAARQAELNSLLALRGEREEQWKQTDEEIRTRRGGASSSDMDTISSEAEVSKPRPQEGREKS